MNANELADKLLEDLREVDLFNMDSDMYGNRQHYIEQLESVVRQQQAEIEALKAKTLTDEVYFCSRCGKRLGDGIHTCTPPTDILRKASEK